MATLFEAEVAARPSCPKCGGAMYDERAGKRNPKAPDWRCMRRNRGCDGVVWPPRAERSTEPVTEAGMYRDAEGTLFKVQQAKESGRLYAKKLQPITGKRMTEVDTVGGWEFVYDAGAVFSLRASDRLSLDEAKAWGIRYGVCCVCGARLKDAESVQRGIGPICAGKV